MLNGKATIILSAIGLIKKGIVYMNEYFRESKSLEGGVKIRFV